MVKSNRSSFTLIEILVVAGIIVMLSGTSLFMFSTYRNDKDLSNQVSQLTSILELAKNKAIAGDVALCGTHPTPPHVNGYSIAVNPTSITLLPNCDTTPTPIIYSLPSNIVYITPTFSLQFNGQNYSGATRRFPIKNTDTGSCKFVQIDETGLITSGDCSTCLCP